MPKRLEEPGPSVRAWPALDAPKAACVYPWCTRRLTFRREGSGRQPMFCGQAHRDLYGRERRTLTRQLAAARQAGHGAVVSQLEWKLIRYPSLQASPTGLRDAPAD